MNDDAIVFAMANPTPEIMPEDAAPYVRIMATGRSDYPNQINNVLAFPGIFRGALDAGAPQITEEMKLAAAQGIAMAVNEDDLSEDYIIPSVFNREVAPKVAEAVVEEAKREGIARFNEETGTFSTVEDRAVADAVKVLVTGASGFIGSALCDSLLVRGDTVVGLTRDPSRRAAPTRASPGTPGSRPWNGPPAEAFEGVDGVVNLLGEKINQRWTDEAKERIMESRRTGTHNLVGTIAGPRAQARGPGQPVGDRLLRRPRRGDRRRVERARRGLRRRGRARVGEGGARGRGDRRAAGRSSAPATCSTPAAACSAQLLTPFKLGVGGPLAGGDQYVSWIHVEDEVGILLWALDNEKVSGVVNATAPNPVTNRELLQGARPRPHRPAVMPVPGFALDLMYGGEFGQVLQGRPAGDAAAGAGPRLRVPPSRARRGAGRPALARDEPLSAFRARLRAGSPRSPSASSARSSLAPSPARPSSPATSGDLRPLRGSGARSGAARAGLPM